MLVAGLGSSAWSGWVLEATPRFGAPIAVWVRWWTAYSDLGRSGLFSNSWSYEKLPRHCFGAAEQVCDEIQLLLMVKKLYQDTVLGAASADPIRFVGRTNFIYSDI